MIPSPRDSPSVSSNILAAPAVVVSFIVSDFMADILTSIENGYVSSCPQLDFLFFMLRTSRVLDFQVT